MAILKGTQINGNLSVKQNLTVDGNLNVQGDLTYVGVKNLRVKDHQIELNTDESGVAVLTGENANQAGIVIRGAKNTGKNPSSEEASILYNYADDTLVVNKTIEGTVASANNAASANKVVNPLTVNVKKKAVGGEETESVVFDGSAAKTVNIDLKALQDQIEGMSGATGSVATQINNAINALNSNVTATATGDAAEDGVFVLQSVEINESAGKLTSATPTAVKVEKAGAAAAAKTELIGKDTDTGKSDTIKGAKKYADDLAANKADTVHTHEISNVNGLDTALAGKQDNLSEAQLNAVNSGITKAKVDDYEAHVKDSTKHITADERTAWNAKQNALSTDQLNAVNSGITADKVSTLESASHTHSNQAELNEIKDGDVAKWNAAEQNANKYTNDEIKKLGLGTAAKKNVLTGTIANSPLSDNLVTAAQVKTYTDGAAADAVAQVVADAPADFDTLKEVADWIQNDKSGAAALQTDVAGLKTKVSTLESASHTHGNKDELDKIEVGDKAKWDKHVLDADIHVTAQQKADWTAKQDALTNAATLAAITSTQVSNWDDAAAKAHEHANKEVLNGITADKVAAWESAASASVVNSVGGKSGALTLKGGSTKLGEVNLSISDTGQISAAIVSDSFDAKGAADTALNGAKAYTDEKVAGLKTTVDNLSNDALKGVAAGTYVSVSTKLNNSQTISVTTKDVATASDNTANGLALAADVKKYVDDKNALQNTKIDSIENSITGIQNSYVQKAGDTMTGKLTMNAADIEMSNNGTNGIIFGNMKIVWNNTDKAIEFIPTTA